MLTVHVLQLFCVLQSFQNENVKKKVNFDRQLKLLFAQSPETVSFLWLAMSNFPSLRPLTRQTHSVCYLAVELEVVNQLAWREG